MIKQVFVFLVLFLPLLTLIHNYRKWNSRATVSFLRSLFLAFAASAITIAVLTTIVALF